MGKHKSSKAKTNNKVTMKIPEGGLGVVFDDTGEIQRVVWSKDGAATQQKKNQDIKKWSKNRNINEIKQVKAELTIMEVDSVSSGTWVVINGQKIWVP